MRLIRLTPAVVAAALNACALESELLNSERIEQQFGSYGIEVLSQTANERRSNLYSLDGEKQTCRTYAVVQFHNDAISQVAATHAEVLAGQSLGATFKASGWSIGKVTLHIGTLQIDKEQQPFAGLMRLDSPTEIALHVYRLDLHKDSETIEYATIIEAHHPDYLTERELLELYGGQYQPGLSDDEVLEISTTITYMD